ncbi:hypothetical protein ElyMa_002026800 [Elysia marginata]|uniref:Chitin-binding type-2 domain-containing protein n=1 Tax=Elysia marginata TaxID=1093978 RepID=A0AAV4F861_9GAST|nr:hypothetical protein ElyMa_002026800 [Elysia marginata]
MKAVVYFSIYRNTRLVIDSFVFHKAYKTDEDNVVLDAVTEKKSNNKKPGGQNNRTEGSIIFKVPTTTASPTSSTSLTLSTRVQSLPPPSTTAPTTATGAEARPPMITTSVMTPLTTSASTDTFGKETTSATVAASPATSASTATRFYPSNIPVAMTTAQTTTRTATTVPTTAQLTSEKTTTIRKVAELDTTKTPTTTTATKVATIADATPSVQNEERASTAQAIATEVGIGLSNTTSVFEKTTDSPSTSNVPVAQEKTSTSVKPTISEKAIFLLNSTTAKTTAATTTAVAATTTTTKSPQSPTTSDAPMTPMKTTSEKPTEATESIAATEKTNFQTTAPDAVSRLPRLDRVTLIPTVISVKDVSATLTDDDVTVTCEISNPHDWTAIVMTHIQTSQSDSVSTLNSKLVTLEPTAPYVTATVYSNRVRVTYDVTESSISVSATISGLGCADHGIAKCSLTSRTGAETSGFGLLSVTSPPAQPGLTAPLDALENREVTPPIICSTKDVGYPHWTLSLQAVLLNSGTSIKVPTEAIQYPNGNRCSHSVTLVLKGYLPVLAANGTRLVCQLLAPKPIDLDSYQPQSGHPSIPGEVESHSSSTPEDSSDRDMLSDEQMLMVIPESICHNRGRRPTLIRHPYVCSRYIACEEEQTTILSCPPDQCFDPVSGNCGVQAVFLEPVNGALDEGLAGLACSIIHVKDWTHMRIRRHSWGAFYDDMVEVNSEGQVTWHDDSLRSRAITDFRTSTSPQLAELYVWIYDLECDDEDSYKCEVDREEEDSMSSGHLLKVYARASTPVLKVPTTAVEGQDDGLLEITCEATLGRPRGSLTLKRKFMDEADFLPVSFSITTMQDKGACLVQQKGVYTISEEELLTYNASRWLCDVTPSTGALRHLNQVTVSEEKALFVVPGSISHVQHLHYTGSISHVHHLHHTGSICGGQPHHLLPHPVYGCEHFLHCGDKGRASVRTCRPGNCFNALSHWCDIPAAITGQHGQCEERNGYLPHGQLCNKFITCAGGVKTIQECPTGTVYASDGQCTADIHEAFCSKHIYGARSRS